jgi:spore germination protein
MNNANGNNVPEDQISTSSLQNLHSMKQIFANCQDIFIDNWSYGSKLQFAAFTVYCHSLAIDSNKHHLKSTLQNSLIASQTEDELTPEKVRQYYRGNGVTNQPFVLADSLSEAADYILEGYIIIFFDTWQQAICFRTDGIEKRPVMEPTSEPVVQGPREGTNESLSTNLGMIRQRVKTPMLKIEFTTAGTNVKTKIAVLFLEHIVNQDVLALFHERIQGIEQYDVLGASYIEEWIEDSMYSPFPQYRYTERTDNAAAALLDGKILVLIENSPMILICPSMFVDFFGTSEDYYVRTVFASLIRLLRLFAFFIALTLPSLYVALSTFHPELIPTVLLLTILDSREGIPFPALFEALIMEIVFELLREAGIRLPRPVGAAVSIVGALVIGQAAITAQIASPIMVIVVALTGIASFAIPHYDMAIAIRVVRFPLMLAAGLLGGFGLMIGFLLLLLHLTRLQTLGQPYLSSFAPLKLRNFRDIFIRAPLKVLLKSPRNRRLYKSRREQS